jgi:hypothetical protein
VAPGAYRTGCRGEEQVAEVGLPCAVTAEDRVLGREHRGERPERQRGLLGGDLQRLRERGGAQAGATRREPLLQL